MTSAPPAAKSAVPTCPAATCRSSSWLGNWKTRPKSLSARGLDVKAAWSVRQQIIRAKEQGAGVVLFSGDLEELFAVSDRIVVLYRGAVIGEVQPEHAVPQDVILLMMGGSV